MAARRRRPPGQQHHHQDQRPHQVELFFDGERPQVLQGGRRAESGEIRLVLRGLPPVAGVRHGCGQGGPERAELSRFDHRHGGCDADQHDGEGGQQPAGPPYPEGPQAEPPVAVPLGGKQVGDQVSAEDEEDIDPEESAGKGRELLVKGQDREHGQRPDPIQSWYAPRRRGLRPQCAFSRGLRPRGALSCGLRSRCAFSRSLRSQCALSCGLRSQCAGPPAQCIVVFSATSERSFLSAATTIWSSANRTVSFSPSVTFVAVRTTVPSAR